MKNLTIWRTPLLKGLILAISLSGLVACSGDKLDDLRSYVQGVKAKKGGRVAPIPEVKPFESFTYQAAARRSPFEPSKVNPGIAGGPQPDMDRRREALESFPLDTLHMVGTVAQRGDLWAIIRAPDGLVYRVARNNHMGQNSGRITLVTDNKVELVEIVSDGAGAWQERQASLSLTE